MPPGETTPGLSNGIRTEARVAQAWFWDGYYVRRGIDLQHKFGNEVSTVTDLDVLGFSFDPTLHVHKAIGEVKTGKSSSTPKPLDRALWLRGLRELTGAALGEVTTTFRTSSVVRDICRDLGVNVQHLDDLDAREARLDIKSVDDRGSQGETVALLLDEVRKFVKNDAVLERGYWFLISEVWFLQPFDALKRTLGLIRELSKSWPPEENKPATRAARWFLAEATSITTLNLAVIAGQANTMDADTFHATATARLASGDVPFHSMSKLSERVDQYVAKLLGSAKASPEMQATAMGAFHPTPPDYTDPLLELVSRLAAQAGIAAALPRQFDLLVFERLVHRRDLSAELQQRIGFDANAEHFVRLIAAFLRGQLGTPEVVDKALTTPLSPKIAAERAEQQTLFDK